MFANGQFAAVITLTVRADNIPELNEVTRVSLTDIIENGVPPGGDQTRGASIVTGQATSFITVTANDAPHGVILWSANASTTAEVEGANSQVNLSIIREFGTIGDVVVSYM